MHQPPPELTGYLLGSALGEQMNRRHKEMLKALEGRGKSETQSPLQKKYLLLSANGKKLTAVCQDCKGGTVFPPEFAGEDAECVHCQQPIRLLLPDDMPKPPLVALCSTCKRGMQCHGDFTDLEHIECAFCNHPIWLWAGSNRKSVTVKCKHCGEKTLCMGNPLQVWTVECVHCGTPNWTNPTQKGNAVDCHQLAITQATAKKSQHVRLWVYGGLIALIVVILTWMILDPK